MSKIITSSRGDSKTGEWSHETTVVSEERDCCKDCVYAGVLPKGKDGKEPELVFCDRYPPETVGGIIMVQETGLSQPRPEIISNSVRKTVLKTHWCGEFATEYDLTE